MCNILRNDFFYNSTPNRIAYDSTVGSNDKVTACYLVIIHSFILCDAFFVVSWCCCLYKCVLHAFFLNVWFYKQYFTTPTLGNQFSSFFFCHHQFFVIPDDIWSESWPSLKMSVHYFYNYQRFCRVGTCAMVVTRVYCVNLSQIALLHLNVTSLERYFTLRKITAWLSENSTGVLCQPLCSFIGTSSALFCKLCWRLWAPPRSLWFWWISQTYPPNRQVGFRFAKEGGAVTDSNSFLTH